MRRAALLLTAFTLIAAACGGAEAGCSAIADDGMELIQDAIDELDGRSLSDLTADPFDTTDFDRRSDDIERRSIEAECTDEEMAELFIDRVDLLEAGDSNQAGQFLISFMKTAAEDGEFTFGS